MEVSGKIKWLDETKTYGNNGFRKREVVITTEEQYPQHIMVEFIQDKCDLLNTFKIGQNVKIGINLRGQRSDLDFSSNWLLPFMIESMKM